MSNYLVISVFFYDRYYHGDDTIPSPFRLFQALVAGVGLHKKIKEYEDAFKWFEKVKPPLMIIPKYNKGKSYKLSVPNNEYKEEKKKCSMKEYHPRSMKEYHPILFDNKLPFVYLWEIKEEEKDNAEKIIEACKYLYQLGRSIDLAYAKAEIKEDVEDVEDVKVLEKFLENLSSQKLIFIPPDLENKIIFLNSETMKLKIPCEGSFDSLEQRFASFKNRITDKIVTNPPLPKFKNITYNKKADILIFRLLNEKQKIISLSINKARKITKKISRKIRKNIELSGEKINIIPLPSIGHEHVDYRVRRFAVEIPHSLKDKKEDIIWVVKNSIKNIVFDERVENFFKHYGIDIRNGSKKKYKSFYTVTPIQFKLQNNNQHSNKYDINVTVDDEWIKICHKQDSQKEVDAFKMLELHQIIYKKICDLLRNNGVWEEINTIIIQKEPFHKNGICAKLCDQKSQFKNQFEYWHAKILFKNETIVPLSLCQNSWGILAPCREEDFNNDEINI